MFNARKPVSGAWFTWLDGITCGMFLAVVASLRGRRLEWDVGGKYLAAIGRSRG